MKIKTDYTFPEQYRLVAEEYISYKRSMGFIFGYDDQKKCDQLRPFQSLCKVEKLI